MENSIKIRMIGGYLHDYGNPHMSSGQNYMLDLMPFTN